jgi:hypothetical protein
VAPHAEDQPAATPGNGGVQEGYQPAPDEAENDGVAQVPKGARPGKSRPRNRRHGRSR